MMNGFSQTDVFTLALGLTEPWRVTDVEMVRSEKNPDKLEVHITVDYQEGSKVPWVRSGSGFTLLMEAVLLTMLQQMPVSQVAKQVGEHDTRLWRLISLYVEQALAKQDFSDIDAIGVDEYSHKGHRYITVFFVTSDMCHGFRNEMSKSFPQSRTTVDKFHVVKMMGVAAEHRASGYDQCLAGGIQLDDKPDQTSGKRFQKHEEFHGYDLFCLW